MSGYRELMRRKLLEQMYDKMSDEEKRTFVQLTMQNKDHTEIMSALNDLRQKADSNHQCRTLRKRDTCRDRFRRGKKIYIGNFRLKPIETVEGHL